MLACVDIVFSILILVKLMPLLFTGLAHVLSDAGQHGH